LVRVFVREAVTPVRVPELRKRQVGEVRRTLERLKLRLSVNPPNAGSGYRVYRQSPRAGTEVRPGTVIRVDARAEAPTFTFPAVTVPSVTTPTVDVPKVTVPNLRSRSLADARKILERLGLELRYSPRNAAENYWVVGQDPPAGRKVDRGASVNLKLQVPIY
jgi:beta-lactam-binding protein with PASTA domain